MAEKSNNPENSAGICHSHKTGSLTDKILSGENEPSVSIRATAQKSDFYCVAPGRLAL